MTGGVVALLLAAATLVLVGPWRRVSQPDRSAGTAAPPADLAAVVAGVASRLRTGVRVGDAWSQVLGVPVGDDGPDVRQLRAVSPPRPGPAGQRSGRWRPVPQVPGAAGRAQAVVCANRMAAELGAPLAPVLDTVAQALAADAEAAAELSTALAGPQASARLVGWLPLLGLVLGVVVGADPVAVLTDGGPGTAAGIVGVTLFVVGRTWSRALVDRARRWQR
ncbi:MAG: type II secretion protein F [Micrococcales bacterium]|nr:type II secretion protein F [Micrococcales bacterium]